MNETITAQEGPHLMAIRQELKSESVRRFWEKVNRVIGNECWEWTAAKNESGYGVFGVGKETDKAHRIAWRLINGEIPKGIFVCHHCDNPACCNPSHLFLGTNDDNVFDMLLKGRNLAPPSMAGWNRTNFPQEFYSLLGTIPDYKLAEKFNSNKKTVARLRKQRGIASYAEQTGNSGRFNGVGLHPCWGTQCQKG